MDATRHVCLIVNPVAGSGYGRELIAQFRDRLRDEGHHCDVHVGDGPDDFQRRVEHAANGETIIAAAGGDGTVRVALKGLIGRSNPLLLVPLGTENLLARQLGIQTSIDSVWETFNARHVCDFDLAMLNDRPFATIVGVGFDAEVVARLTRGRQGHITHLDYFWPLWRTFWQYRFPPIRVLADGREVCNEPALVFVGNIPRYAIGLQILRDARWDDGKLDLCIMRCRHQGPLLEHAFWTILNSHVEHRLVSYHQVRHVRLEALSKLPLQCDGDPAGDLPAEIRVLPAAVRLLLPPRLAMAVQSRASA